MSIVCSVKSNLTPKFTIISKDILPFAASRITAFDGIVTVIRLSDVSYVVQYEPNKNRTADSPSVFNINGNNSGNNNNRYQQFPNGGASNGYVNGANHHNNGMGSVGNGHSSNSNSSQPGQPPAPQPLNNVRISADIDDVTLNSADNSLSFCCNQSVNAPVSTKVYILACRDFNLLNEVITESKTIRNLKLQMEATARDIYYSNLYSVVDPNTDMILQEEFSKVSHQQKMTAAELLMEMRQSITPAASAEDPPPPVITPKPATQVDDSRFSMDCLYCGTKRVAVPDTTFTVHPYVPQNYEQRPIFLCITCAENWKDYREKAIRDDLLILENEINEEICCSCSDMPEELIMCSKCPRSFCSQCLSKMVSTTRFAKILKEDDWLCMCCSTGCDTNALLSKDNWQIVKLPPPSSQGQSTSSSSSKGSGSGGLTVPEDDDAGISEVKESTPLSAGASAAGTRRSSRSTGGADTGADSVAATVFNQVSEPENLYRRQYKRRYDGGEADSEASSAQTTAATAPPVVYERPSVPKPWTDDEHAALRKSLIEHNCVIQDVWKDEKLRAAMPERTNAAIQTKARGMIQDILRRNKRDDDGASNADTSLHADDDVSISSSVGSRRSRSTGSKAAGAAVTAPSAASTSARQRANSRISSNNSKTVSEYFYFGQYVKYYDNLCLAANGKGSKRKTATEDSCFLCKDGGELIECDHVMPSGVRCKKVYHEDCLSYKVPDSIATWLCPRHYCDACGSQDLEYVCMYCPFSICTKCQEAVVQKVGVSGVIENLMHLRLPVPLCLQFGLSRYMLVPKPATGEFGPTTDAIICQNCIDGIEGCKNSKEAFLSSRYQMDGELHMFPGVYSGDDGVQPMFVQGEGESAEEEEQSTTRKRNNRSISSAVKAGAASTARSAPAARNEVDDEELVIFKPSDSKRRKSDPIEVAVAPAPASAPVSARGRRAAASLSGSIDDAKETTRGNVVVASDVTESTTSGDTAGSKVNSAGSAAMNITDSAESAATMASVASPVSLEQSPRSRYGRVQQVTNRL
jgi:hypothetical protein